MTSVNRERVQMFVDALESGEFEQGIGALRLLQKDGTFKYCCLGVATEIALRNGVPETVASKGEVFNLNSPPSVWNHDKAQFLCDEVMEWYGFTEQSPRLKGSFEGSSFGLMHLAHQWNDSYGASFHQIADMFRKKYLSEPETTASD